MGDVYDGLTADRCGAAQGGNEQVISDETRRGWMASELEPAGSSSWSDYVQVRPENGDGYLTLGEAKWQWQNGKGAPVTVDANQLDFSGLHVSDVPGGPGSTRAFTLTDTQDFLVHGTVTTRLNPGSTVSVLPDRYNFDIKPWSSGTFGRNIETFIARYGVNGPGVPYNIYFRGTAPIQP
jgi:hypothetical protein